MAAVTDDIVADFLIEAQEIVDRLGEQVVQLELAPQDKDLLNAVFRGFHTIKGGAGFLGVVPMVDLCHAVEEAFDAARQGKIMLGDESFDASQRGIDLLATMLEQIGAGAQVSPPPAELISALKAIAKGEIAPKLTGDKPAKAKPAPAAAVAAKAPAQAEETTVRVDTKRLDMLVNLVGELVLARNRLKVVRQGYRDEALHRAVAALDLATSRLQSSVMKTRMQPVSRVFQRFPKLARDVARSLNKDVELVLEGADTELDRKLVDALADPLVHLVRNAIDHGIEMPHVRHAGGKSSKGNVILSARQEGDHVTIEIQDDGAGIDPERLRSKVIEKGLMSSDAVGRLNADECLNLIFLPGFSTKTEVTDISGRGVGMDVVQSRIRELGGTIQITSALGEGSRFTIRVPLTLAILPTLLVRVGDDSYALPLSRVDEVLAMKVGTHDYVDGRPVLDLRQSALPLIWLRGWLGMSPNDEGTDVVVVLQCGDFRFGLIVDQVRGREEVVIKALPNRLRGLAGYAGATLIGDGSLAMILDVEGVHRSGAASSVAPNRR